MSKRKLQHCEPYINKGNSHTYHRGRIQAQGENTEKSEKWAQNEELLKTDALTLVNKLKNKLTKKELCLRLLVFNMAENYIKGGPVSAPISKSYRVKNTKSERLDIEVHKGVAFSNNS